MEVIQQAAAVATVLGLLAATLWWLRRRGFASVAVGRKPGRRLEALERLPLGPQHTLHLVRLGETTLLVASSPTGCSLIQSLPNAEIAAKREVGQ